MENDEDMINQGHDPWDTEGFDNHWKMTTAVAATSTKGLLKGEDRQVPPARRLQDLTLSSSSHHGAQPKQQQGQNPSSSWPFEVSESSPCRWSGTKNNRPTAEARQINQKLFDPDFTTSKAVGGSDHMDVEEVGRNTSRQEKEVDASSSSSDKMESESFGEETDDYKQDPEEEEEEETSSAYSFGGDAEEEDDDEDFAPAKSSRKTFRPVQERRSRPATGSSSLSSRTSSSSAGGGSRRSSSSRAQEGRSGALPTASDRGSSYTSGLAWNAGSNTAHSHHHADTHQSKLSRRSSASGERRGSSRGDDLSSSCHGQVESLSKQGRSCGASTSVLRRRGDELSSTTFHGPVSQSRIGPSSSGPPSGYAQPNGAAPSSSSSASRRAAPGRTKSSDGAEMGLGAATLHGGASVSRIRGGKRRPPPSSAVGDGPSSLREEGVDGAARSHLKSKSGIGSGSSSKPHGGERRLLQRAMSIRTVKRPEEYAVANQPQPEDATAAKKTTDSSTADRSSRRSTADGIMAATSSHGGTSSRSSASLRNCGNRSSAALDELAASSAHQRSISSSGRQGPHRSTSMQVIAKPPGSRLQQQDKGRELHRSGSGDSMSTSSSHVSTPATSSNRRQSSKAKTSSPSPPSATAVASEIPSPRSRDLLVLLREKKKVTDIDLLDQDNRRLLHYLMMEHKMGIKQREIFELMRRERQKQTQQATPA